MEVSNYLIDVLKDECCTVDNEGWYTVKEDQPEQEPIDKKTAEPVQGESSKLNNGPWSDEEHQRFLEGLKLFGKDWGPIEKHIGTRANKQIRAHAQKFTKALLKMLETKKTKLKLSENEATFYFGILNSRFHKTFSKEKEHMRAETLLQEKEREERKQEIQSEIDQVQTKLDQMDINSDRYSAHQAPRQEGEGQHTLFDHWREVMSDKDFGQSLGQSVKFRGDVDMDHSEKTTSFKPVFFANWEAVSEAYLNECERYSSASTKSSVQSGSFGILMDSKVVKS
mmetsp:Transcript_8233/g.12608  ORF Transcript_8233/g.12608 Transcript_8233/m.12608 type:complete len:282 (-) Transcript_8233:699-1544(-)